MESRFGNGSATAPDRLRFKTQVDIDYPVVIERGIASRLGELLRQWHPGESPLAIISDETVAACHGSNLTDSLKSAGWHSTPLFTFPPGEFHKTLGTFSDLIARMMQAGVSRRSLLLCLGGGVVLDTAGFVAASYMRGIGYVNVPTSLLGQVDAAIGGKVGVNHPLAKNFMGAFYHPRAVVIDADLLGTLPAVEWTNGLAEIVKVAMIGSAALFERIEARAGSLTERTGTAIDDLIEAAVRAKIELVASDPFERDLRRTLNLGHTFAHPLEVAEGFQLRHGFAVSIGICLATRMALARKRVGPAEADRIYALLRRLGLPTRGPDVDPERIWNHSRVVRSVRGNHIYMVMPTGIGTVTIVDDVSREEFLDAYRCLATVETGPRLEARQPAGIPRRSRENALGA